MNTEGFGAYNSSLEYAHGFKLFCWGYFMGSSWIHLIYLPIFRRVTQTEQ